MMWPALIFVAGMVVFPFLYAGWLSLQDFVFGSDRKFAGIANYVKMASDPEYTNAFKLTFMLYFLSLALQLVLGTWLAFVLNRVERFKGFIRTVLISPFMLPPVVVGLFVTILLWRNGGVAKKLGLHPGR